MYGKISGSLDRRAVLGAIGIAAMTAVSGCTTPQGSSRQGFFERTGLPIGLQVYTLGDEAGKDIDATFASIAAIGYREIEIPGLLGHAPADVKAAADRAGLTISSIHVPLVAMGQSGGLTFGRDASDIAETLGVLGAKWAVAPIALFPPDFRPSGGDFAADVGKAFAAAGPDIWKRTAEMLNRRAEALQPLGIQVGYHNHNLEFLPIGDTNGWEILARETDPSLVRFEVDLGWIATSGLEPVAFLQEYAGRIALIHVKDVASGNQVNHGLAMKPTEVGAGTLSWETLLPAAYAAGARHFYVEQEPPFTIPRIEAARRGYDFLAGLIA
ncbi:MAG: sugar phosphate isomerase/epimerase [Novosphingobium sp.]|nr:sugar phosphate isomerase/epimerase [Novosphingobium sp.]